MLTRNLAKALIPTAVAGVGVVIALGGMGSDDQSHGDAPVAPRYDHFAQSTAPTAAPTQSNCIELPSACGYRDATNSGAVGAGKAPLTKVPSQVTSGPGWTWDNDHISVTGSGAMLANLDVSGSIEVYADNVTIRHSIITETGESWGVGLRHSDNVTVQSVTITSPVQNGPQRLSVGIKDIYGDTSGALLLRNNISHTSSAIQIANGLVQGNYIHDMGYTSGDHINGITVGGGDLAPMMIRHNTILNQYDQTDAIALFQDFGGEANKTITGNFLAGGSYTLYGGGPNGCTNPSQPKCDPSNHIVVTNNRFSNIFFRNGGSYGPVANFNSRGEGNVFSGNFWDNTLSPLRAP